jgi:hypothetical protein
MGFWASKTVLSAVELELFTQLGAESLTGEEIEGRLGPHPRATHAFLDIENLINDARRDNAFGLMMSLNMLIEFGDAFDFTGGDFAGSCREVGFRDVEIVPLAGPASAGIA